MRDEIKPLSGDLCRRGTITNKYIISYFETKLPPKIRLLPHVVNFIIDVLVVVIVHGVKSLLVKLLVKNYSVILYTDAYVVNMNSDMIMALSIYRYYNLNV